MKKLFILLFSVVFSSKGTGGDLVSGNEIAQRQCSVVVEEKFRDNPDFKANQWSSVVSCNNLQKYLHAMKDREGSARFENGEMIIGIPKGESGWATSIQRLPKNLTLDIYARPGLLFFQKRYLYSRIEVNSYRQAAECFDTELKRIFTNDEFYVNKPVNKSTSDEE